MTSDVHGVRAFFPRIGTIYETRQEEPTASGQRRVTALYPTESKGL